MISIARSELANRLPLYQLQIPGTRTATALIAFSAGARAEEEQENGIAHFLEHMVFKGGEKYNPAQVLNKRADELGASMNAFTSHDMVAFHIKARAEVIIDAVDLLTDFVGRPIFDTGELERERGVIIQEIAMYADQPSSVADDLIDTISFPDHPLGRPILGPAEHIRRFTREDFERFRARTWAPQQGGAFLAGNVEGLDQGALEELFARFPARGDTPTATPAPSLSPGTQVTQRDSNQSHLRVHYPTAIDAIDQRIRTGLSLFNALLGGSMASLLFDEIREKRGLCYSIGSFPSFRPDTTSLYVSSGLDSEKCPEAFACIQDIVSRLVQKGPSREDMERAKTYLLGNRVMNLESTSSVARSAAQQQIFGDPVDPENTLRLLEAATYDDVQEAAELISLQPIIACVGPHQASDFQLS